MDTEVLGFAFAAGLVAAVNPCGFALLPGYLALVVAGEGEAAPGRVAALGRALVATVAMAAGFLLVFGGFGLVISPLAVSVQRYLPAATVVIGVVLVGVGAWLLSGRDIAVALPKPTRGAPSARLASMIGYGVAYAIASLSCTIAPFLAVTSSTFRSGSVLGGVAAYLAYGLGMTLLVGVLAVVVALAGAAATAWTRKLLPYIGRISGILLVLSGLYVTYYGIYELRLFFGDGDADDPVIVAASHIQEALSRWVGDLGWRPLLAVLVAVFAVGLGWQSARARNRRRSAPDIDASS
ncbi:cytochrome c biogenesis CcdA family protein [Nocardia otitidiscaviarum]|uniref:cytochrome c biogenesis CcdA family protein n=1 Tax=Nocardia otitidiscaviarum TaxID=1823 RepID=UPI0018950110|nr:cytochrome c biogenesis protein CcdA [Nocardia otitidiscaviarum]MBF6181476.1 cytochrome c biogenesis protein CcdA [Nocardia otitidiscaviarum]